MVVKTSDVAGDGTTTATVLAQAIVQEGMKFVTAGMKPDGSEAWYRQDRSALVEELKKKPAAPPTRKSLQVGFYFGQQRC